MIFRPRPRNAVSRAIRRTDAVIGASWLAAFALVLIAVLEVDGEGFGAGPVLILLLLLVGGLLWLLDLQVRVAIERG